MMKNMQRGLGALVVSAVCLLGTPAGAVGARADFEGLYARVKSSVVNIYGFDGKQAWLTEETLDLEGRDTERLEPTAGAGFFVDGDCGVVTNAHVVSESSHLFIQREDSSLLERFVLVGSHTGYDLAYLRPVAKANCKPLRLDIRRSPSVGQWVAIIGNPLGLGKSLSYGIISALNRGINSEKYDAFIQIAANVNPGNSGGPVISLDGRVVGVLTLKATGHFTEGLGFAIPGAIVDNVISQLRDKGHFQRVWLGVEVRNLKQSEKKTLETKHGVRITAVAADSPSARAGLKVDDVIVDLDGKPVRNKRDLANNLLYINGKSLRLRVIDTGTGTGTAKRQNVQVAVEYEKDDYFSALRYLRDYELGLQLADLDQPLRNRYHIATRVRGVVVTEVRDGGAAERSGLKAGDLITHIATVSVKKLEGTLIGLAMSLKGGSAELKIVRAGKSQVLILR